MTISALVFVIAALISLSPIHAQPAPASPELQPAQSIVLSMQILEIQTDAEFQAAYAAYEACDFITGDAFADAYGKSSDALRDFYHGVLLMEVKYPVLAAGIPNKLPYLSSRKTILRSLYREKRIECFLSAPGNYTDAEAIEVAELGYQSALYRRLRCGLNPGSDMRLFYGLALEALSAISQELVKREGRSTSEKAQQDLARAIEKVGDRLLEMPLPSEVDLSNCIPKDAFKAD